MCNSIPDFQMKRKDHMAPSEVRGACILVFGIMLVVAGSVPIQAQKKNTTTAPAPVHANTPAAPRPAPARAPASRVAPPTATANRPAANVPPVNRQPNVYQNRQPSVSPNTTRPSPINPNLSRPSTIPPNSRYANSPYRTGAGSGGPNSPRGPVGSQGLPPGTVNRNPNGTSTLRANDGRQYTLNPQGRVTTFHGANNTEAHFRPDGHIQTVRTPNMTIVHGPGPGGRIAIERADHTRIVTNSAGHGYVQKPFVYRNATFAHRTYYVHGVTYTRVYRTYAYRGVILNSYVPVRYYSPAFYGYAYAPWRAPVYYRWGWAANPWYGYYGPYFAPSPVYASPSLWLTDYVVGASLAEAYQQRADTGAPMNNMDANAATQMTPQVKQAIADEVQREIATERSEVQMASSNDAPDPQSDGLPKALADGNAHAFVVAADLDVTTIAGNACTVTEGDVLQLNGSPVSDAPAANVQVLASKGQDCQEGSVLVVALADLQEMQNHMRAMIDKGLEDLQNHGNGLPAPPAGAAQGLVEAKFASSIPPADSNAPIELQQGFQQATQEEQQVLSQADKVDAGATVPATAITANSNEPLRIALGQTIDQVTAAFGPPTQIFNLGGKRIYVYPDMKVTFLEGKVADVQ